MITTNNCDPASRLRLLRNFGFVAKDKVVSVGINGKMSEVSAAMGLTSIESVAEFTVHNWGIYSHYRELLARLRGIKLTEHADLHNFQYVVLEVNGGQAGITRDALMRILWSEAVIARRYFYPGIHRMEPYATLLPRAGENLFNTEMLCESILCLPTGSQVGRTEVEAVCSIVRLALRDPLRVSDAVGNFANGDLVASVAQKDRCEENP